MSIKNITSLFGIIFNVGDFIECVIDHFIFGLNELLIVILLELLTGCEFRHFDLTYESELL